MCFFTLFLSVDPSLGKVDYNLMSDQTLMEMMFEGFDDETKKQYQDNDGMYRYVCEWSCIKCDEHERVIEIRMFGCHVRGSLDLRYIPPKVKVLLIASWDKRRVTGSVDLTRLPVGMQKLCLSNIELEGEIDLAHLPKDMVNLSLDNNQLTGEIDLTHLPEGMPRLFLQNNQLSGEIDLTNLPKGMKYLALNNNQFSGEIELTHLPDGMLELSLKHNLFSGALVIKKLPQGMKLIDVQGNHFNAIAVVDNKTDATIKFEGSGVELIADENGSKQDIKKFLE